MTDQLSTTTDQDRTNAWDWLNTEIDGQTIRFWIIVSILITTTVLAFGAWWTYGWNHDPATSAAPGLVAVPARSALERLM